MIIIILFIPRRANLACARPTLLNRHDALRIFVRRFRDRKRRTTIIIITAVTVVVVASSKRFDRPSAKHFYPRSPITVVSNAYDVLETYRSKHCRVVRNEFGPCITSKRRTVDILCTAEFYYGIVPFFDQTEISPGKK